MWDVPAIDGADFRFRGLAWTLREAGFDVWMPNFRGCGPDAAFSDPPFGQRDWFVDHFILYDAPAITDHVRRSSGSAPFLVGCSMGAMVLSAFLQGARLGLGESSSVRVIADPDLAVRRQAELSGAVFITFPAALRWPRALYDADGRLNWPQLARDWSAADFNQNFPFEAIARIGWLQALLAGVGKVPLDWLRADPSNSEKLKLPSLIVDGLRQAEKVLMHGALRVADAFTGSRNHKLEIFLYGRRHVIDAIKAGVLLQMGHCVRAKAFVSALGDTPHSYSDHYHLLSLPLLVVAGGRDRIANAETTRDVFFDCVRSGDKTFQLFDDLGHGEFSMAPIAARTVFPIIRDWIAARVRPAPTTIVDRPSLLDDHDRIRG